jgi:hypothetical protein
MSKAPKIPPPTPLPPPQNEYFYNGNQLAAQRVFNPASNGYESRTFLTPEQQAFQDQANQGLARVNSQMGLIDTSAAGIDRYKQSLIAPQMQALENSYRRDLGDARGSANASGMMNSIGFEAYKANQLDRNKGELAANIANNAEMNKQDYVRKQFAPLMELANYYQGGLGNQQAQQMNYYSPTLQGSEAANNYNLQRAGFIDNQNMQRYQMKASRPSLFSSLLGVGFGAIGAR